MGFDFRSTQYIYESTKSLKRAARGVKRDLQEEKTVSKRDKPTLS